MLSDARYAFRQLAKHPGFTAVAVLTLALGIGANTAIYSVVDGVLLRPTPFRNADRLMMVWETDRNSGTSHEPSAVPDFLDFRERSTAFAALAAFSPREATLTPDDGGAVRLASLAVSGEFLPMVGVAPRVGRGFSAEDAVEGGAPVVLIGEGLWERMFARDPAVVGRTLRIDDRPVTVIGVLPAGADFGALQILRSADYERAFADRFGGTDVDLWLPLQPSRSASRDTHPIFVMGRLAPAATRGAAQAEMTAITADLETTYPSSNAARGAHVEPLVDVVFGPVRPALMMLLAAVLLVLLVAAVNVANLLLARGTTRMRDVAVRTALGATTARIGRQFLVEGVVLSVLGGIAGVGLAVWGTQILLSVAPPSIPRLGTVGVNLRILGVTLLVSVAVGVVFGMLPMLQARRLDLQTSLKGESTGSAAAGTTHGRVRSALVVVELALAVTLVVGAGLLVRSFWLLRRVDPGFQTEGVLKAEFQLPATRYPVDFSVWPDFREMHRFNDALLDAVRGIPGVRDAAIGGNGPTDAGFTNSFAVVGREAEARDWPEISVRRVSPGYFGTLALPMRRGRPFAASDGTRDLPVAIVNEAAVDRFFAGREPIGQQIRMWGAERTIVGVVADEKFHGLSAADPIALYLPLAQAPSADGAETLLLRGSGDPAALTAAARRAVLSVDPGLAVFGVEPLAAAVSRSMGQERFTMLLLGGFAALAIFLALVGIHGVLSYMVARRSRELGLRVALGASRAAVIGMVVGHGLRVTAIGLVLGLLGAAAGAGLLRTFLFGVSRVDPLTYVAVSAGVVLVALLASYLPARRATLVQPMEALRRE